MMNRAMVVSVLHRMENSPSSHASNQFSDVLPTAYYYHAVSWAAEQGIVSGVGNGQFLPNEAITREQLAAILYQYSRSNGLLSESINALSSFSDASQISAYAVSAMHWAVGCEVIAGDNGQLRPKQPATRAQTATMLMNFIQHTTIDAIESEDTAENIPATTISATVDQLNITIGNRTLTATLEQNSSTQGLLNLLANGSLTIAMSDRSEERRVGKEC